MTEQSTPANGSDRLAGSIESLSREFANFRTDVSSKLGRIDTSLNVVKWIGAFVATFLGGLVIGAVILVWNASALNSEVKQQGSDLKEMFDRIEKRMDRTDAKLDLILRRLD